MIFIEHAYVRCIQRLYKHFCEINRCLLKMSLIIRKFMPPLDGMVRINNG
jgi:hypothetical protein